MIKVKFLELQEVEDGEGVVIQRFRAGQVVELNNASARFWLSRGLALDVQAVARETREAKTAEVVEEKIESGKAESAEETAAPGSAVKVNPTSPKRGRGRPRSVSRPDQA